MTLDLAAIEKAAKEATPGPWHTDDPWIVYAERDNTYLANTADLDTDEPQSEADARFIALANPSTILALCERIRELEAALKPFATCIDRLAPGPDIAHWRLTDTLNHNLTVADVMRARSALITETNNG